jgi:hypothetical protein
MSKVSHLCGSQGRCPRICEAGPIRGPVATISLQNGLAARLRLNLIVGVLAILSQPAAACTCHLYPACAYVGGSAIIFVGRVTYSNDDDSVGLVQATLVRFEVEEAFKGLTPDVHEVWIDPGSFTSCYAAYPVGQRYLVFASSKGSLIDLMAMTRVNAPGGRKPPPPGFDLNHPPAVYLANECSGTREISAKTEAVVASDLAFLRAWRDGKSATRAYGLVLAEIGSGIIPPFP